MGKVTRRTVRTVTAPKDLPQADQHGTSFKINRKTISLALSAATLICIAIYFSKSSSPELALQKWAISNGALIHGVSLHKGADGELHYVVSKPLKAGDEVLKIPETLFLNCMGKWMEVQRRMPKEVPAEKWCPTFRLLYERNDKRSFWAPYINSLLNKYSAFWNITEKEIDEFQIPTVVDSLRRRDMQMTSVYAAAVAPLLKEMPHKFKAKNNKQEHLRWAASMYFSRAFPEGMIPLVDMLHHMPHAGETVQFEDQRSPLNATVRYALVRAAKDYLPGEHFGMRYLNRSGWELAERFGRVLSGSEDIAEVRFNMQPEVKGQEAFAIRRLSSLGIGKLQPSGALLADFLLQHDSFPDDLLTFARTSAFNPHTDDLVLSPAERDFLAGDPGFYSFQNDIKAADFLIQAFDQLLSKFPTTIHEDQRILDGPEVPWRKRLIVHSRLNTKTIYTSVRAKIAAMREDRQQRLTAMEAAEVQGGDGWQGEAGAHKLVHNLRDLLNS